ncbi:MAG: hypothetical protein B7Z66_06860 [Chromatiales bacterium 21-64-14]|nr:MAG: hypothetical protein B7Z66_06860 [Chromatiales bacterium 21-64-14]HQU16706.1 hypothetical protein [Gammaproteobacteria bacterium]
MATMRLVLSVALLLGIGMPMAGADTFLLDAIHHEPANDAAGVPRPTRGLTMAQVEKTYGAPEQKLPAVGKPPITRWVYKNYTVYFEDQYVIRAVLDHPQAALHPQ